MISDKNLTKLSAFLRVLPGRAAAPTVFTFKDWQAREQETVRRCQVVAYNHLSVYVGGTKMAVKVAINGFGRIGRLAFRQMFGAEGFEIVAINDLTSPEMLAHLLKYDSTQGRYEKAETVSYGEDSITIDGKEIKIYAKANAAELPWGEIGVDVVLECTGFYTSKDKAQAHIDAGA